jgi:hypothetical protein
VDEPPEEGDEVENVSTEAMAESEVGDDELGAPPESPDAGVDPPDPPLGVGVPEPGAPEVAAMVGV